MKSSIGRTLHGEIIEIARFHMTVKNQIINI